jgi:energy-coupling factor transport system ATP-binding protein
MDEAIGADRVVVINEGELYLDGTPKQVFSQVDKLRTAGLDVPQVTELFHDLTEAGYRLPADILEEEEGAELLASIIK